MTAEQYLVAVEAWLIDLPWRVRKNLAADLRVHLGEIPAGEDLVARLGSPQSYALELRAAAGLTRARGPVAFLRARRPRNLAIAVALLVVAGLLIGAAVWASSYQPLATGHLGRSPDGSRPGALGESVVQFRNRKPFQLGFSFVNDGRFSVRVLGIPVGTQTLPFRFRVFAQEMENGGTVGHLRPFQPFTINPGGEWYIVLRGIYANCHDWQGGKGSSVTYTAMPVRARLLLWTHTAYVSLLEPLVITFPRSSCG